MQTIEEIQEEILEDFDMFEDWMKYEYLIDLGKNLFLLLMKSIRLKKI